MKEYKKNYLVERLINWIWLFLTICFILLPVIIVSYIKDKDTNFTYVFIFYCINLAMTTFDLVLNLYYRSKEN